MTKNDLLILSKTDISNANPANLVNIEDVKIDVDAPISCRAEELINQIQNPYCFMCGNTPVKVSFAKNGVSLSNALFSYFNSIKM